MSDDVPELRRVEPDELRFAWHAIRDRVADLAAKSGSDWIADDVFHEILIGEGHLWVTPEYGGFVVLQIRASGYTRELYVWIACNETQARARDYWPQLMELARFNKCRRTIFDSTRRGFERHMPNLKVMYSYSEEC